jgi:hypothetical protein
VTSCLEDINLDTGERILNVYCILDQGPEQELELSYIAPTGGTISQAGEGVVISLYDDGALVEEFSKVSETKWNLDFSPEGGHMYRLEVNVPGEEQLTAETTFPPVSVLQEVWYATDIESPDGRVSTGYYELFELNADEDFIRLQIELADAEKRIDASSGRYNDNVEIYNMCTDGFLVSYVAGRIGFLPRERFEPPKVSAKAHGEAVPDEAETEKN